MVQITFQAAAMQQMYAHYVQQYMQYLQTAGGQFAAVGTWNGAAAGMVVHDPRQVLFDSSNSVHREIFSFP